MVMHLSAETTVGREIGLPSLFLSIAVQHPCLPARSYFSTRAAVHVVDEKLCEANFLWGTENILVIARCCLESKLWEATVYRCLVIN